MTVEIRDYINFNELVSCIISICIAVALFIDVLVLPNILLKQIKNSGGLMKKIDNKDRTVRIKTTDGKSVSGHINILGFDRASDFLLNHDEDFLMIYNGGMDKSKTIFINKKNIVLIEDLTDSKKP